jgi:hypothetical protein
MATSNFHHHMDALGSLLRSRPFAATTPGDRRCRPADPAERAAGRPLTGPSAGVGEEEDAARFFRNLRWFI